MFFILSKTLNYLAQPLVILGLLVGISFLIKKTRWRKALRLMALALTFIFTNDFITNEIIGLYETPITPLASIERKYEFGIVLTGVTAINKQVADRVYVVSSPDRVNHSVMLYKRGIIKKLLISGGSGQLLGDDYSEAKELFGLYVQQGVDSAHLLLEGGSRNTAESAIAVKAMLATIVSPENCILITSGYHMPRSRACFEKQGWRCDVFATDIKFHKREFTPESFLIPKIEALFTWQAMLKEWVGLMAYKVQGYV